MSEETPAVAAPVPKKSKTGLIIGIVIAMITLVGGSVAGAVLGPKLLGSPDGDSADEGESAAAHEGKSEDEGKSSHGSKSKKGKEGKEGEKIVSVDIPPIVVDLRDGDGRLRHLKVGMAAELAETVNAEEFKLVSPRGREATLTYLRSLTFEEVADPAKYASIKDEISKRMIDALGADKVHRILLVDFVLQ